jgi:hypothetical protein
LVPHRSGTYRGMIAMRSLIAADTYKFGRGSALSNYERRSAMSVVRSATVVGMLLGVGSTVLAGVPAQAASVPSESRTCVIVVDKVRPGEQTSHVLRSECASSPTGKAALQRSVSDETLLMIGYEDADYNTTTGDSFGWYGSAGPCDLEGYGIRNIGDDWNDKLSSFRTYGNCEEVNLFEHERYNLFQDGRRGFYVGDTSYVGFMNDLTTSIHVNAQL